MSTSDRIGIVGTGRMGSNIARHLKDEGYTIAALYDVHPQAAQATARDTGGEVCTQLARVTELSDVVITVVTDDAAMYRIFATEGDSLLTNASRKYFVNTATVTPRVHVEVEKRCEERGAHSIE